MSDTLGILEQAILTALVQARGESYSVPIRKRAGEILERSIHVGPAYTSLNRMTAKGLLTVRKSAPERKRGGRSKVLYTLTEAGWQALKHTEETQNRLRQSYND